MVRQSKFLIAQDNLQEIIDVDASDGRSVPVNMNFIDEGYLTKDTGFELFGIVETDLCHSLFNYKKKNGINYILRGKGTVLQSYNHNSVYTVNATTDVITSTAHGLADTNTVYVKTTNTGVIPAGLSADTTYYVISSTTNTFKLSLTSGGSAIDITDTGTGDQFWRDVTAVWDDLSPTFTEGAEFGFRFYDDELFLCNAVDNYQKWDGTTFTEYASAPKGNILEIFEDRMFVAGVLAEPLTTYYSNVGAAETFTVTDIVKPLGTDKITNLNNYYGTLLIFKRDSIWKLTFVYDQIATLYVPKLDQQSGTYGAASRKAVSWVENDLWFSTGVEVRAIGFIDNISGDLGVNKTVISENIKETLKLVDVDNYDKIITFYDNRRFYLGIPIDTTTVNTVFVCHTLYKNSWTKYSDREKSKVNDFMVIDSEVYTTKSSTDYGVIKWNTSYNDISTAISSEVFFTRLEDKEFNRFRTYRYLDLKFKDLLATVTVTLRKESSDISDEIDKSFSIGNGIQGETIAEVAFGDLLLGGGVGDEISYSPFVKKRVSFLSKNQAFVVGLSNDNVDETFTIAEFALSGKENRKRTYSGQQVISMS